MTLFVSLGGILVTCRDQSPVALGGIAAEYITYGQANGGMSDLLQLEALFGALKFDQQQTNVLLRTNVMNTVSILERERKAHDALVDAMGRDSLTSRAQVLRRNYQDGVFLPLTRPEEYAEAHRTMVKVFSNVLADPKNEKFRTLRKANAVVQDKLKHPACKQALLLCGFTEEEDCYVCPPSADLSTMRRVCAQLKALPPAAGGR
ncbi:unnamed protein product [Symbiodinium natans]|uniref:PUB domain-containing protein n=1 Tax=Symbiodinium natans TaxID=878477 RepID=A0A812RZF8_9DINO|nr:unnamed protein product [Symbiodinium natans]